MACPTICENLWLLDIQFIYFLRFIVKYFTVQLKNFCPTSQSIVCGVFLWFSWGNSHFLLGVGKLFSWGFLVRSCVPVARSPCRVLQGGKSKFWGSALTVLLVKRFCRSRVCSPCSCFGTEVVCLACLKAWQRNNHKIQRWHHWHSCAMLIPRSCICF